MNSIPLRQNQRYQKIFDEKKKQEQRNVAQTAGGEPGPFHHQPQIETSTLIAQEPTFNSLPFLST
ncbi:hypothetical protein N7445_005851 [Penicillium cf. griseofulvum]|nr:hypothetical protein N7445_005851 [Penicillium cf. griseofulvum]